MRANRYRFMATAAARTIIMYHLSILQRPVLAAPHLDDESALPHVAIHEIYRFANRCNPQFAWWIFIIELYPIIRSPASIWMQCQNRPYLGTYHFIVIFLPACNEQTPAAMVRNKMNYENEINWYKDRSSSIDEGASNDRWIDASGATNINWHTIEQVSI